MGNMGTIPATGYESSVVQTFSSPTGTSHTMTYTASVSDMILVINNVIQEPTVAYTTSGTTLTTGTLISGDTMYIVYLALTRQTVAPGADTVTNAMIVDNAINSEHYTDGSIDLAHMSVNSIDSDQYVDGSIDLVHMSAESIDSDQYVDASIDNAHLADDAVGVDELSATGTASSSTFLRGDNAWAAAGSWTDAGVATTTSGASTVISGIAAAVQHIIVVVNKVSTGAGNQIQVQLGDAGGLENSGYVSANFRVAGTTITNVVGTSYFIIGNGAAAGDVYSGMLHLHRSATGVNDWLATWNCAESTADIGWGAGAKTLSAELTQIALQTNGTFDAGGFDVYYRT